MRTTHFDMQNHPGRSGGHDGRGHAPWRGDDDQQGESPRGRRGRPGFGRDGHAQRGGPGPFGGPGGFGGPGPRGGHGPFGGRGGGPRARRGDVRLVVLALLSEEASNGYGLIRGIAERTDQRWTPGPGSVYPVLRRLVDEGLVAEDAEASTFTLTDEGTAYLTEHADDVERAWTNGQPESAEQSGFDESVHKLMGAARQLSVHGTDEQRQAATEALETARRALYGILAE